MSNEAKKYLKVDKNGKKQVGFFKRIFGCFGSRADNSTGEKSIRPRVKKKAKTDNCTYPTFHTIIGYNDDENSKEAQHDESQKSGGNSTTPQTAKTQNIENDLDSDEAPHKTAKEEDVDAFGNSERNPLDFRYRKITGLKVRLQFSICLA